MTTNKELIQARRIVYLEGKDFNNLEILSYIGSCPTRKFAYYNCKCKVCGKEFVSSNTSLTGTKYRDGCKSCARAASGARRRTHGLPKNHKTYKSWCKIKERCFNTNCLDYLNYGTVGITMEPKLKDDFLSFYAEVGEPPENSSRWSIDRIDNNKGYITGNLRWADACQQARNKGMSVSNKSGVNGVQWYNQPYVLANGDTGFALQVVAIWNELVDGKFKQKNKKFSVRRLGLLPAFALAVQYRKDQITRLNALGYGYAENHGQ